MSATNPAEARVLAFVTGDTGNATAPTLPLKIRLMTANGSDSANGTELAGGSYTPQSAALDTGANVAIIRFEGIANPRTVVGYEIWDSAGSPFRWQWAALDASKTVVDGVLEFAIGALTVTVD